MAANTERQLEAFKNEAQAQMDAHNRALAQTWELEKKHAESAEASLKKKLTHTEEMSRSLHVDKKAVRKMDTAERMENMSRILFFMALLSAEIAVMSYIMNAKPLWDRAAGELKPVCHALIILSPVSYAGAIISFYCFGSDDEPEDQGAAGAGARLRQYLTFAKTELLVEHWMMGCRMFLTIKSISEEDIAAFFLVHRLTAVVFSFFQGLLLAILHFQEVEPLTWRDWNLEWMVVGSLAMNFLIEATAMVGLVDRLKRSIKMEALVYNNKNLAMFDRVNWIVTANAASQTAATRWNANGVYTNGSQQSMSRRVNVMPDIEVTSFRESIEQEVKLWAGDTKNSLELRPLEMEMLVDLQNLMQRRHIRGSE
jgi:hypothetical protein